MHTFIQTTTNIPCFPFYAGVILAGLLCWLIVWGREKKATARERDLPSGRRG